MKDIEMVLKNNLNQLRGKSADHTTNFLKNCGGGENGTMIDGIINMIDMMNRDKLHSVKKAKMDGMVIGIVGTSIIGAGIYLYSKYRDKMQCREKMQEVVEILKQEVALANEEKISVEQSEGIVEEQ
ncbi:MAG: hypothetical protein II992_07940 [Lachnospiraceae bacterium]|nr:hypothetical protein [Lachnospiraceae bacterium]